MHERIWLRFPNLRSANLNSKIENPKSLGLSVIAFVLVAAGAVVEAQQPTKISRMGFLSPSSRSSLATRYEAFRQGMRELGYVEGKNIVIESRYAEGKQDRVAALAADLARLKVDVIVTGGTTATRAAKEVTVTIPIVMTQDSDPVGSGVVASLARPGGNITGVSNLAPELSGKRLELLKEAFPKVARVAFLWQPSGRGNLALTKMEAAAKALGLKLLSLEMRSLDDFDGAFARAKRDGAQALITFPSALISTQQRQVTDFAVKNRLPAMYTSSEFVEAGGLMSYGPDNMDLWRRAADFVDKILKGAKPADLPVQQPRKFEFLVNMNAAKEIGLTIPPNVLVRADRVIR